jgi:hypothetical protein
MSKMPKMPSLSYKPKPKNFDFSNEFEDVLNKIVSTKITGPSDPDENDYKPIRDLLEQFYTMKLNDTIKLLVKLFDNLKILMTKHSGDEEYYKVIKIETFYKNAIQESDLEDIKTKDKSFISKITSSINSISFNPNSKSIYSNLYCSLLIIHYYPIVILDTIFLNAQTSISRLKTNIPKLITNYANDIDNIVNEINLSDDDIANLRSAKDAAAAAALKTAQEEADALASANDKEVAQATISAANSAAEAAFLAADDAKVTCAIIKESIGRRKKVTNLTNATSDTHIQEIQNTINEADEAINEAEYVAAEAEQNSNKATAAADSIKIAIADKANIKQAVDAAKVVITETNKSSKDAISAARNVRAYITQIEPPADTIAAPNRFFGFFGGSNTSDDTMVGGEDTDDNHDIKNTLTIINDVLDETDKTGSLIKYSTEIFYKALTILSISIGLHIDFNSNNIIVNQIKNLVNDEVIQKFTLAPAAAAAAATPATPAADPATPAPDAAAPDPAAATPPAAAADPATPVPDPAAPDPAAAAATPPVGVDHGVGVGVTPPPDHGAGVGVGVVAATPPPGGAAVGAAVGGVVWVLIDQEIKKSIKSIFDSDTSNYTYFGEIIDDIFYNFYNSSQKKLAKTLKDAQENDTQKKNQLKELKLNVKKANLAVHNAEVTKMSADKKNKAADDAKRASDVARDTAVKTSETTLAKARALTSLQDAAAAASVIATAKAEYDEAVESAAAADAAADAAAAAAAAAAADAPAAFKAANDALNIANKAVEEETLKLTTAESVYTASPVDIARTDLLNALYDKKDKKEQKKDPKPTIKNMKSDIDDKILKHFKEIFTPQDSISKSKTGGQKTQKNRYRGGIRKNINSIDSFDSIDSDL